jgi:hypothetical protein
VVAAVLVIVGAGCGVAPPPPSGSAATDATPSGDSDESVASLDESGIRLTLAIERDRTVVGQPLWAGATIENLGPGSVFWDASCAWPVVITVTPDAPTDLDLGRQDWPESFDLFKSVLTPEPYFPDRRREFEAEAVINAGSAGGCPPAVDPADLPDTNEVSDGTSISHRAAWDGNDYMGMPPLPGRYTVRATFAFWRGTDPEPPSDTGQQRIQVSVPILVEGEEVDWLSPEAAIDALLSDARFAEVLADTPPTRWADTGIAFEEDHWVVRLDIGPPPGDLSEPDLIGVVDARTGEVVEVDFDASEG